MAIAPDYAGGVQPAVGVGTEGARFKEQVAPRADFSPFFGAWKDVAGVAAEELDEANDALFTAKDAELRQYLIRQKQDKDTGFMNLHEENALKPDENGASLPDRVLSAANDYRESLMDGWSNAQKAAFRAKTNELLTQQYGVATDHLFKENEKYRVSASNARAAAASVNAQLNYTDPSAIEDALRVGEEEARKQSRIGGLTADDEEYAVRRMKGAIISKVISAAVDAAESDDQAIFTAKGIIGKYGKYLNPDDVIKLNAVIQKKFDSVEASQIGTDFFKKNVASRQAIFRVTASLFTTGADGKVVANPATMDMSDISTYEQAHGVAQVFSNAIMMQESSGLHFVTDNATGLKSVREGKDKNGKGTGAFGLMQMQRSAYECVEREVYRRNPTEAGWLRVKNTPELNKQYGTDYFALMLAQFGSVPKALAAYNAGPGRVSEAVKAYGADWLAHMPEETRGYVPQILNRLKAEQVSSFARPDGSKISALNSPQEFARQYYKQVPEAVIREQLRKQYPQLAASESKLDATVAVVVKKQKEAVDAFAVDQSNTTARLLEKFGATGQVDHSLLNRLTLQAQGEVMKIIKEREAGSTSGNVALLGTYLSDGGPAKLFVNQSTNTPVTPAEAQVIIAQLPAEWQKNAVQTYATLVAQTGASQNKLDANAAALQSGVVPAGYDTTTVSSTMQSLKVLYPDVFKDENDPNQRAVAVAVNYAIAEAVAATPGGKPPTPGTNEFNNWVASLVSKKIDAKSFLAPLGVGPHEVNVIDYDPDDLPRNGPTSAGVLMDHMAKDYFVRNKQMSSSDELTPARKREFFVRFFIMKNPGVRVSDYPMDATTIGYIRQKFDDDFAKEHGRKPNPDAGEKPDPLAVVREYIKIGARGERIPGKTPGDMPGGYISNGDKLINGSGEFGGDR